MYAYVYVRVYDYVYLHVTVSVSLSLSGTLLRWAERCKAAVQAARAYGKTLSFARILAQEKLLLEAQKINAAACDQRL